MGVAHLEAGLCNGCGICIEDCPMDVFIMERETGKAQVLRADKCWECNLCEHICPTRAIEISPAIVRKVWFPF